MPAAPSAEPAGVDAGAESSASTAQDTTGGFQVVDLGPNIVAITGLSEGLGKHVVVGNFELDGESRAFLWTAKGRINLHELLHDDPKDPNRESFATGFASGVVGFKVTRGNRRHGFWYFNQSMFDGSQSEKLRSTMFTAVNYQAELTVNFDLGASAQMSDFRHGGFYGGDWPIRGEEWRPLPSLAERSRTEARDLLTDLTGNHAFFAGVGVNADFRPRAVVGDARTGEIRDLGTLDGTEPKRQSEAWALNAHKQVVGWAWQTRGDKFIRRPCLWETGRVIALNEVPGPRYSFAGDPSAYTDTAGVGRDINKMGLVVGWVEGGATTGHEGCLWTVGPVGKKRIEQMRRIDIGQILPFESGFTGSTAAWQINQDGVIAATAYAKDKDSHGILLVPRRVTQSPPRAPTSVGATKHTGEWGATRAGGNGGLDHPFAHGLDLRWQDVSTTELWFEIERRIDNGPWHYIGAAPANVERYHDREVHLRTHSLQVHYRVRAVNYSGPSSYAVGPYTPE